MVTTWPQAVANDLIWVHDPALVAICVDVPSPCCCQGPRGRLRSGLPPGAMLVSKGALLQGIMLAQVDYSATWGHGDI